MLGFGSKKRLSVIEEKLDVIVATTAITTDEVLEIRNTQRLLCDALVKLEALVQVSSDVSGKNFGLTKKSADDAVLYAEGEFAHTRVTLERTLQVAEKTNDVVEHASDIPNGIIKAFALLDEKVEITGARIASTIKEESEASRYNHTSTLEAIGLTAECMKAVEEKVEDLELLQREQQHDTVEHAELLGVLNNITRIMSEQSKKAPAKKVPAKKVLANAEKKPKKAPKVGK